MKVGSSLALCFGLLTACSSGTPSGTLPPDDMPRASSDASARTTPPPMKALAYPDNEPGATVDTIFGQKVADPYRWLEDVKSPAVVDWMDRQDKLTRSELEKLAGRDEIRARLKELLYVDVLAAPVHRGNRAFFRRRHADREKAIVYTRDWKGTQEKVLLDPNAWSKDGSSSLGNWAASWDGEKVAYTMHVNNSDEATLYVVDVKTGARSEVDVIEGAKYAQPSWTRDSKGFYYTWLPTDPKIPVDKRPGFAEVRFHKLGTPPASDVVVHERTNNPSQFIDGTLSEDGSTLFLGIYSGWTSNDVYFRDATKTTGFTPLAVGIKAHFAPIAHKGRFYVMSDDGAPRYAIYEVDPKKPARKDWKILVPEDPTATLETFQIFGNKLVLTYLQKASSRLEVRELDGKPNRVVELPSIGTVTGVTGRADEDEMFFGFESFTSPLEIRSVSVKGGASKPYSAVKLPVDTTAYQTEQVEVTSKDGTKVSMFIVSKKGLQKNGENRVLLYGYGGFQVSETPAFVSTIYPWLERGGVYAVPNLRGGGEYGEAWHEAGMRLKKQNVFDDFIAAAEYLVKEKYTSPKKLVIAGGSNGGLLVGAAMTQRPELFAAVLCSVPLLDMVRYHQFGSGRTWISEYGSSEKEDEFKALFAYSPYHRVKKDVAYPPLLLLSADSDDRVDPLHARKFAAALQDASRGGPVLLRIERNAGHGGADLRRAEVEKGADRLSFALDHTK